MKLKRWEDIKRQKLSPETIEKIHHEVEEEVLEMNLQAVRELAGKTQVDVARACGVAQSEVSRTERREDHLLSTLRRYVEALGGKLEISAHFGDKSIKIRGV